MRPITVSLAAAGNSSWVPLNRLAGPGFYVGLGVKLTSGASLTYRVQHTFDDLRARRRVTIARSGTTATVTDVDHRLSVGDSVIVTGAGAPFDGTYDVASVIDANSYTYTVANSGATASAYDTYLTSLRVFAHETLVDLTASADGNYAFPCSACRLRISSYTSGKADLSILQAG